MSIRNLLHFALIIPALAGICSITGELYNAVDGGITDLSFSKSNSQAWTKIIAVMPTEMPQEYPENETQDATAASELTAEQKIRFDENNSFIIGCSILVILGAVGVAFVGAAKTQHEPCWNPLLRTAAIVGVAFITFYVWGYHLAYPGDFNGFLPSLFISQHELSDPVFFGMEGMNEFTDLLYISAYAAFFGALVITQTAGQQTALSAFIAAIPMVAFSLPLSVAWKWGGGWLDASFQTYDFAGSVMFHWHAGAVVLITGIILKLFRRNSEESKTTRSPIRLAWWIPGIILYFLVMIGMNAGSVLSAAPEVVAACFQSTIYAAITTAVLAGVWGIFLKSRTILEWIGHGLIAGAVVVSGVADKVTLSESITLAIIAGGLVPPFIYLLDRFLAIDPLAIAGVHGLAGFISTLAAAPFGDEIMLSGQVIMLLTIPLISMAFAVVPAILFGALKLLFFKKATPAGDSNITPPPLPQR